MDIARLSRLVFGDRRDPRKAIAEIFPDLDSCASEARALAWAGTRLRSADVDPIDEVRSIAVLREAEPRLGLKAARYLAHHLALRA
ncbi:hypothetical protein LQ938_06840 [Microbacterium sp. cx-55]|uniref:hypothetical protein n=1 Tax=Microbacterium sp. cx-55 TaxID=2875948 RepID=UPI001CBBB9C3|nr:hypothetical protein [Microbacterium sp. cx-55]MBZ4486538.1 hypothetical protein [Microbacterium sp. cx-55]UGB36494.1 hypothetical protein LQ938_06840 [Microbacterium sp. cx-55]